MGCRAPVPDTASLTHRYIGASPGCWVIYAEVLEKEYSDYHYARAPPVRGRLLRPALGDSFCAGHPVGRCSSCRSLSSTRTRPVYPKLHSTRQRVASSGKHGKLDLAWLEPPASLGEITVLHVRDAKDPAQHVERTLEWAWSVWEAWAHHREIVRLCSENPPSVQFGE